MHNFVTIDTDKHNGRPRHTFRCLSCNWEVKADPDHMKRINSDPCPHVATSSGRDEFAVTCPEGHHKVIKDKAKRKGFSTVSAFVVAACNDY